VFRALLVQTFAALALSVPLPLLFKGGPPISAKIRIRAAVFDFGLAR